MGLHNLCTIDFKWWIFSLSRLTFNLNLPIATFNQQQKGYTYLNKAAAFTYVWPFCYHQVLKGYELFEHVNKKKRWF